MSNAVATKDDSTTIVQSSDAMLMMIERVVMDPNADIAKMEKLIELKERVDANTAKKAYMAAFSQMQSELPEVDEKGQGHGKITYAKWEDINRAIKPVLQAHGFGLSFKVSDADGKINVAAVLSHCDGHSSETAFTLPADASGSKNAVQALGSTVSYGKRYTACALLNITSRNEPDNDGAGPTLSKDQCTELRNLIADNGMHESNFLNYWQINGLEDIPVKNFDGAKRQILAKARTQK